MESHEFEQMLERMLGQDFSKGTEAFRDALLERCLGELNAGGSADAPDFRAFELSDDQLDLLSAAGTVDIDPRDRR